MNYLAHALLAGQSPALMVGGVIGDFIKGPLPGLLPQDLARGVALHRAIDSFAELSDYSASIYATIARRLNDIAAPAHFALQLMAEEDWLSSYAGIDGISDVLARMSRRARQPNPLDGGEQEFLADPTGFASDFENWLGDARHFADQWIAREILG